MRRRSRTRRVVKWLGTVASALVVLAFAVSVFADVSLTYKGDTLGLVPGRIRITRTQVNMRGRWPHGVTTKVSLNSHRLSWRFSWDQHTYPAASPIAQVDLIAIPLWAVFLVLALPTAYLWYDDRRRFPAHCCQKCGYDSTGNVSGRCPECGQAVRAG